MCKRDCLYRSSLPECERCWTSSYTELNTEEHQCPAFASGKRRRGWSGEQSGGANRGLRKSGEGIICVYLSGRQMRLNCARVKQIRGSLKKRAWGKCVHMHVIHQRNAHCCQVRHTIMETSYVFLWVLQFWIMDQKKSKQIWIWLNSQAWSPPCWVGFGTTAKRKWCCPPGLPG